MAPFEEHEFIDSCGQKTFYYAAGPTDGNLIILCHGWPAIAKTWKAQIGYLASRGYRVVAPDMPGYGRSGIVKQTTNYSLENVNHVMVSLLTECGREAAIWIGHDWGAVAVWSFAAHYPEKTTPVAGLTRPYHTLEYGLEEVLKTVNRGVFPADQYPYAQYDYQAYFEKDFNAATAFFDADPTGVLRGIYARGRPDEVGKPGLTATVTKAGGWFGGAKVPPPALRQIPAVALSVDEDLLGEVTEAMTKTGFWAANAWYMNHALNRAYSVEKAKNNGRLDMPVLFIGANWDPISDVSISNIADAQKEYCTKLRDVRIDSGHWPALEKSAEVNSIISEWLQENSL